MAQQDNIIIRDRIDGPITATFNRQTSSETFTINDSFGPNCSPDNPVCSGTSNGDLTGYVRMYGNNINSSWVEDRITLEAINGGDLYFYFTVSSEGNWDKLHLYNPNNSNNTILNWGDGTANDLRRILKEGRGDTFDVELYQGTHSVQSTSGTYITNLFNWNGASRKDTLYQMEFSGETDTAYCLKFIDIEAGESIDLRLRYTKDTSGHRGNDSAYWAAEWDYDLVGPGPLGYTVTANANGGIFSDGSTVKQFFGITNLSEITEEPTRSGFRFDRWAPTSTGGLMFDNVNSNTTIYAQWIQDAIESRNITVILKNTDESGDDVTLVHDLASTEEGGFSPGDPLPTYTWSGKTFNGWKNVYGNTVTTFPTTEGTYTYTAQWIDDVAPVIKNIYLTDNGGNDPFVTIRKTGGNDIDYGWEKYIDVSGYTSITIEIDSDYEFTSIPNIQGIQWPAHNKVIFFTSRLNDGDNHLDFTTGLYTPSYNITFNYGGGVLNGQISPYVLTGCTGTTYLSNYTPEWTDRTFKGWKTSQTSSTYVASVNSESTLYADWDFTVTFVLNGGSYNGSPADHVDTTWNENRDINDIIPTRDGYTFNGWLNAYGEFVASVDEPTTLYADWVENTPECFTITLNPNGGSIRNSFTDYPINVCNPTLNLSTYTPIHTIYEGYDRYDFLGWYVSETPSNFDEPVTSVDITYDGSVLYARWERHNVSVTLNHNDPESSQPTIVTEYGWYGEPLPAPIISPRGFQFDGWTDVENGGNIVTTFPYATNETYYGKWTSTLAGVNLWVSKTEDGDYGSSAEIAAGETIYLKAEYTYNDAATVDQIDLDAYPVSYNNADFTKVNSSEFKSTLSHPNTNTTMSINCDGMTSSVNITIKNKLYVKVNRQDRRVAQVFKLVGGSWEEQDTLEVFDTDVKYKQVIK